MYCKNCGHDLPAGQTQCPYCGENNPENYVPPVCNNAEPFKEFSENDTQNDFHFCPNCGTALKEGMAFCPNCGYDLRKAKKNTNNTNSSYSPNYSSNTYSAPTPPAYCPPAKKSGRGFSIAALCLFYFPILCIIFGVLGIVKCAKCKDKTGIILGIVALSLMVIYYIIYSVVIAPYLNEYYQQIINYYNNFPQNPSNQTSFK